MSDPSALLAKADKKASGGGGGFSFFGGGSSSRYEEAADLYKEAANALRLANRQREAGQALERAAECQLKSDEREDAANTYVDAFKCFRREEPAEAIRVLDKAIQLFTAKGGFRRAANYMMDMGDLYQQLDKNTKAIECFNCAGEWYLNDQAEALANKSFLKTADLAALEQDYGQAIERFEQVAKASLNNNLSKYSVKDYFLRAGICHLASGDIVAVKKALERYKDLDNTFASAREAALLQDMIEAVEAGDQELFAEKLFAYDSLSKLDNWKTTILVRIKNAIDEEPGLL